MTIHIGPRRGDSKTACCGVLVSDLGPEDRITSSESMATCDVVSEVEDLRPQPMVRDWEKSMNRRLKGLQAKRELGEGLTDDEKKELGQLEDISLRVYTSRVAEKSELYNNLPESVRMRTALSVQLTRAFREIERLQGIVDGAYMERARILAWRVAEATSAVTMVEPWNIVMAPATDVSDPGWWILFMQTHQGQLSWHLSPEQAKLFDFVEKVKPTDPRAKWDGHTTEQKYERIEKRVYGILHN